MYTLNLYPLGNSPTAAVVPLRHPPTSSETLCTTRWISGHGPSSPNGPRCLLSYTNPRCPCPSTSTALLKGSCRARLFGSDSLFHSMTPAKNGCPARVAKLDPTFANALSCHENGAGASGHPITSTG